MESTRTRIPLLSVILPVCNGEKYVAEALRSVLLQEGCTLQTIVVDDGSTDGTPDIVRSFGSSVLYIRQDNAGPASARNVGLDRAEGDFVGFIDADDVWPAAKVKSQLPVLTRDHRLGAVLGMTRTLLPDGTLAEPRLFMQMGCGLYRRSAFDRVGGFDPALRFSEDIDWFARAREKGLRLKIVDDVALHFRIHEHNMTRGTNVHDLGYLQLIKRSLDRRREASAGASPPLREIEGLDG